MNQQVEYLKNNFDKNSDFVCRKIDVEKNKSVYVLFFESLCDANLINNYILQNIDYYKLLKRKIKNIEELINSPKLIKIKDIEKTFYYLENGFAIIIYKNVIFAIEVKANLDRGITTPQTEPSLYGAKDAFCENYQKNLGIIKKRIKTKDLKIESIDMGLHTKNKISLVYIDSLVSKKALKQIKEKLYTNEPLDVLDSFDITEELKLNKIFPTIFKSERPIIVAKYILKGHIIILVDNTPFSLIIDAKLDTFVNPYTTDPFVKVLRYICLFLTILTPALYIALINYNQEIIPISLLIKFTEQRVSVPFPAIIEAVLMLLTTEILREADVRFPNSYGSAASILGALILGESAVNAGIVSAIMIIVIAITFITNLIFTEIKLISAIRILRAIFLLISSIMGLYGLFIAIIIVLTGVANVKMYDGGYV